MMKLGNILVTLSFVLCINIGSSQVVHGGTLIDTIGQDTNKIEDISETLSGLSNC